MDEGRLLLVSGGLLALGILASLLASRIRLPGLVLFLGAGMLVGSDGLELVTFDDYELAKAIGIVALALILYEGGLAAGFSEIRPVLGSAISLAGLGTLITALITGFTASWLLDLSTLEGLLIGAIVSATDGAAIFALLRGSTLKRRLAHTLEAEAGMNDPVAVLLVIGFVEWITHDDYNAIDMLGEFVFELGIGLVVGVIVGWLAVQGFRRAELDTSGLYPVASLAVVGLAYGTADVLHGSGFLAVYLAGLFLGSSKVPAKQMITAFHDGMAWVAQLAMFLTLGLLVFPADLPEVALKGTLLAFVLVFVARPIAVFVSTAFTPISNADRLVLGWAGLRGAVPVVLALFPVIEGVEGSLEFFNIVFFAVLLSTLLQGTTFEPFAKWLGATTTEPAVPPPLIEIGSVRALGADVVQVPIEDGWAAVGTRLRELGLPRDSQINIMVRDGEALPPRGSMRVEAGDLIYVLARQRAAAELDEVITRWRTGPIGPTARPPRVQAMNAPIFTSRQWTEADGDASRPEVVLGYNVVERLRLRWDQPGALVVLDDGRYAVTGRHVMIGSRDQIQWAARRRLRAAGDDDAERAWWQDVIGSSAL